MKKLKKWKKIGAILLSATMMLENSVSVVLAEETEVIESVEEAFVEENAVPLVDEILEESSEMIETEVQQVDEFEEVVEVESDKSLETELEEKEILTEEPGEVNDGALDSEDDLNQETEEIIEEQILDMSDEIESEIEAEEDKAEMDDMNESEAETYEEMDSAEIMDVDAANTSFDNAINISVNKGYRDKLVSSSDVNYYKFSVPSSGYVSLNFGHEYVNSGNEYWKVYLYDSNRTEMMCRGYAGNTTETTTTAKVGIPAGTYYIKIDRSYYSDVSYTFKVNYTSSSAWETEFNDSFSSADAIFAGAEVNGNLMSRGDVDYYVFTTSSAGYVSLDFSHEYENSGNVFWDVYLYDFNKKEMMCRSYNGNTTETTTTAKVGIPAGIYYIKINRSYYSDVRYTFKVNYTNSAAWETEFNDSFASADIISTGTAVNGSLMSRDDVDYYVFTTSSAGYVSLDFSHEYENSGNVFWDVYLYDFNKKEMMCRSYNGNTTETTTTAKVGILAGTYYIKINRSYYSDVRYAFKVNYTSSAAWETEFNDSFASADAISAGAAVSGSLMNRDDVDYYVFTTSSAGYVSLDFSHEYENSGNDFWDVYLYDSNNKEMMCRSYVGNTTATTTTAKVGIPAGTYYIKIDRSYYSDVSYTFKVNYTGSSTWETEFNDSFDSTDVISVGTEVNGSLMNRNDADYYRIEIPTGGRYQIEFNHDYINNTNTYWKVNLYNSNKESIAGYFYIGKKTSETETPIFLSAGTYYFKVYRDYYSDYEYTLKLNEVVTHTHSYNSYTTKATTSNNGSIVRKCSCGSVESAKTIYYPKTVTLSTIKYSYNGKVRKPSVTVVGSDGKKISSSNYTVTYANGRKNVGSYKIKIAFRGNYSGTIYKTFTIVPKGTSILKLSAKSKGFSVQLSKQKTQTTGYQIQYSTSSKFRGATTKTIKKNSTTFATYTKLKKKQKYYVRVRTYKMVSGKAYYSSWSAAKSVKTK